MNFRRVLIRTASSLPGAALLAGMGMPGRAVASKMSKRDFAYQDRPKEGKRCGAQAAASSRRAHRALASAGSWKAKCRPTAGASLTRRAMDSENNSRLQ